MGQSTYGISLQGASLSMQKTVVHESDNPLGYDPEIPAGIAGTLSTRTDNDTGIVTVASGHGVTADDTIDLYSSAGVLIRKDMDVTGVTGTTISIDLGTGSNLPTLNDPVIVSKQKTVNTAFDGDALKIFGVCLEIPGTHTSKGRVLFEDADADDIADIELTANVPLISDIEHGQANPVTGDPIVVARVSNGSTTAGVLKIIAMNDATP
jgi:hypothetical protein